MCVCRLEPSTPWIGFGMNVAYTSSSCATSFTASRNVMTESAIVSASVWRRSTSCCEAAIAWCESFTGTPELLQVRR